MKYHINQHTDDLLNPRKSLVFETVTSHLGQTMLQNSSKSLIFLLKVKLSCT